MVVGMEIHEHTAIRATLIAIYAISIVRKAEVCLSKVLEAVFTDSDICFSAAVTGILQPPFRLFYARMIIAPTQLIVNHQNERLTIKFSVQTVDIFISTGCFFDNYISDDHGHRNDGADRIGRSCRSHHFFMTGDGANEKGKVVMRNRGSV